MRRRKQPGAQAKASGHADPGPLGAGTRAGRFLIVSTVHLCQVALRTWRMAFFSPSWASEIVSFTPFSLRLLMACTRSPTRRVETPAIQASWMTRRYCSSVLSSWCLTCATEDWRT